MTCAECFFWHPVNPGDESAPCWLEPPRVLPIIGSDTFGKPMTIMQNMTPQTERGFYCRHFDSRARPVIKVAQRMP